MSIKVVPVEQSYSAQAPADEVLSVRLDGGLSRSRSDLDGASWTVSVAWVLDFAGFQYLYAYFRHTTKRGGSKLGVDLVLDAPAGSTGKIAYDAYVLPGTLKLAQKDAGAYQVTAQLEVLPSADDPVGDQATIDAFVGGGDQTLLALMPIDSGYGDERAPDEAVRAILSGPRGSYRPAEDGAARVVPVGWALSFAEYQYLLAFYRLKADRGATPFKARLVLDGYVAAPYVSKFVPGTLTLQSKDGPTYFVSARLEARPAVADDAADTSVVNAYAWTG